MRKAYLALTVLAVVASVVGTASAHAQAIELVIDVDVTIRGDEGDVITVKEVPVDEALQGRVCAGYASTANNASEWDGNDLIITSGDSSTVVYDFEAVAGGKTFTEGSFTLGETVRLDIRLGPGGISSEGLSLVLSCQPLPPPTTTTTTTTTLPPPATTVPPPATTQPPAETTTTEPPPVGGVSAGGGSEAARLGVGGDVAAWLTLAGVLSLAGALGLALHRRISSED